MTRQGQKEEEQQKMKDSNAKKEQGREGLWRVEWMEYLKKVSPNTKFSTKDRKSFKITMKRKRRVCEEIQ